MPAAGYIAVTFEFRKEGRRWVACCDELGTATFGRSIPEAERKLEEAVTLHLNTLEDVGEVEHFFKQHSIKYYQRRPTANVTICAPIRNSTFYRPHIQRVPELAH